MSVQQMISSHPRAQQQGSSLADCIRACIECAETCTSCADACLAEDQVADLRRCIRLNLDCADICNAAAAVMTRQTEPDGALVRNAIQLAALAARACAEECEKHADMHEHCRICAEACRRCEQSCNSMLGGSSSGAIA